jgi:glucosamine--fructose-6-phosphate aminotransferase (isomerizing)
MKITPYISDILDQPAALERCLAELPRRPALTHFADGLQTGRYRRVILTGMGSSYFAAIPLQYRLLRAGMDAPLLETSELIHCLPQLITPENLLVVISQSGQSAEALRLLEIVEKRAEILAVTNEAESPLALGCQSAILLHAGAENAVSCKTYLNTLAALTALGDDLTAGEALLPQLASAPQAADSYLQKWETHVAFLSEQLEPIDHLFLLGRGDSLAAAGTGGLIIKESAQFAAQSMSAAAFRHGPLEMTAANLFALVFAGGSATVREINLRLAQDVRQFGGVAHLVESNPAQESVFHLPPVPDAALPVLEMFPTQMLSLALAEKNGHEAGVFQFGAKVTVVL